MHKNCIPRFGLLGYVKIPKPSVSETTLVNYGSIFKVTRPCIVRDLGPFYRRVSGSVAPLMQGRDVKDLRDSGSSISLEKHPKTFLRG